MLCKQSSSSSWKSNEQEETQTAGVKTVLMKNMVLHCHRRALDFLQCAQGQYCYTAHCETPRIFILFCFILFYFVLFCFILFYFILFLLLLFFTFFYYFILFYFILFYFILVPSEYL